MAKRGRPAWEPTKEQTELAVKLASVGIPQFQIAMVLEVSEDTLNKALAPQLARARIMAHARVAGKLFEGCMEGVVPLITFYLRTQGGWKEDAVEQEEKTATTIVFNRGELPERLKTIEDKTGTSGKD